MDQDRKYLLQALDLAARRKGSTSPNPAVGAVVVKDGKILSVGVHEGAGLPHAEVDALEELGEEARDATIYVTLEPCCHFGKTPPCTDLLINKKLKRVVYGFGDPNPKVAGKGAKKLQEAGMTVEYLHFNPIEEFYRTYAYWTKTGNTWMTGKIALSKDEKVSGEKGAPVKITGTKADEYTHYRRGQADVLLTSLATLKTDNPRMDVRLELFTSKKPVWVLDRELKFSFDYQLMTTARSITLVYGKSVDSKHIDKFKRVGIDCVGLGEQNNRLNISELAFELGKKGYHEAWCEFGPRLFSSFAEEKAWQEFILYRSPQVEIPVGKVAFKEGREKVFRNYKKVEEGKLGLDCKESWVLK